MSQKLYAPGQVSTNDPLKPGPGTYDMEKFDRLGSTAKKIRMQGRSKNM